MNNETEAKKSSFEKVITKLNYYYGKTIDIVKIASKTASKAVCYGMMAALTISLAAVAVGAVISPGETKKIAKGEMVLVEKSLIEGKDRKINLLEQEGSLHRAVRKIQGKPLE